MSEPDDEFAEFETTEDEIDAMLAAGVPVTLTTGRTYRLDWPNVP